MNICSYYAMCDCSLKVEVDHLVGVRFARCFVIRRPGNAVVIMVYFDRLARHLLYGACYI
jgi:hypothetical protein